MNWFDKILTPNTADTYDFEKIRKLRLLNLLILSDLFASIFYTLFGFLSGHITYGILNIGAALIFIAAYLFVYFRKVNTAVVLLIIFGDLFVFFYLYYFDDIGIEYYLISAVIVLSFVFGDKPFILSGIFAILCVMLILIHVFSVYVPHTISDDNLEMSRLVKYPNIIFSIFLIYMAMRQFHIDLDKSFTTITNQNIDLADKNSMISEQKSILEHSNRTKNKILSIMAHDLRGPINGLKGTLYLLIREGINEAERQRLLKTLHDSTTQTSYFLELLLVWGKSQFEGVHLEVSEFDLCKLADEVVELVENQVQLKSIAITRDYSGSILVKSDKNLIHISIRNLVNNAIKFTPEKGKVAISLVPADNKVDIIISDTGTGIAPDRMDKLFSMEMGSRAGTMNEKGMGLGLILVKECIENCQGTIQASSKVDSGTTFTITLPMALS